MATIKKNNPWTWQDPLHFGHGVEVTGATRVLYLAGQVSVGPDGRLLHPGDMKAQLERAFDNLESVLTQAGFTLANVVRLNYYVTDMAAFGKARSVIAERLGTLDVKPAGVLLGVSRLADPGALVEIEATAAA
jgi:enamine deaminase RidA (YjgF/YER057c/UK114 family)